MYTQLWLVGETLLPKDSLPLLLTYIVDLFIIAYGWFLFSIHPHYDNHPVFVKVSSPELIVG